MCPPKIRLYKWRHVLKPGVWLLQVTTRTETRSMTVTSDDTYWNPEYDYKWRHVLKPGVWLLQNEAIGSVLSYLLVVTTPCYVYSITSQHDASRVKLYSWWQTVGVPLVNMWFSDFSWTYMWCGMFQSQFVLRSTLTTKWKRSRSFSVVTQLWCCCWWCRFDVHRTPILDECDQLLHAIDWSVNNSCNDTPVRAHLSRSSRQNVSVTPACHRRRRRAVSVGSKLLRSVAVSFSAKCTICQTTHAFHAWKMASGLSLNCVSL